MHLKVSLGLLLCFALTLVASARGKRPWTGGWQEADKNSAEIQDAARQATIYLESASNSSNAYRLVEVIDAKQQVVAGMNYDMTMKIGRTDCNRRTKINLESCPVVATQQCKVTVYERLWENFIQVTYSDCEKEKIVKKAKTTKPPRPTFTGGEHEVDPSDAGVLEATSFAMTEISGRHNGRYTLQHQRVIHATSQVVRGAMYRIKVQVSLTDNQTGKVKPTRCFIKVWDVAGTTRRFILQDYKCGKYA